MNKGLLSFLLLFIALFVGAFYFSNAIQSPFIATLNYFKSTYHNSVEFVSNTIDKHIYQAQHIGELQEKLLKYENNHLVMRQMASELNDLFKENDSGLKIDPRVELVRAISYQQFGDFNKVWIDVEEHNSSKIYGLTYKELVAGIVISKDGRALGLLNRDFKSSYSVYVGGVKAPGIAHGKNSENLIVKFIPSWFKIKVGDEVTTSGLDEIFFKGLKVGKIISVSKSQGYQNAIVEPYYQANNPSYFHMIRSVR